MYTTQPHQIISDEQFSQFVEDGYLIIPRYIQGDELRKLQAAQRCVLHTWELVRENPNPPADRSEVVPYPFPDVLMSRGFLHPEIIRVAKRFLKSEDIFVRVGSMLTRYPGFVSGDAGHIDNGNNSLLPMTTSAREYGQFGVWIHLEEVKEGQAPLLLVKNRYGSDLSKAEPLICPEGTICLMNNYTRHASSPFTAKEGQRFVWGSAFGRADHHFEGHKHYTQIGRHPIFRQVVSQLTPEERVLMRFPPPNHPYYTRQTLVALEEQYPGWNASGAYKPME